MVSVAGNLGVEHRIGDIIAERWDDQTPGRKW